MRCFLLTCFLCVATLAFAQYTVKSVPNEKLVTGSYVSNPDNILSQTAVTSIDTTLRDLENKTTVQVAVVAVQSIGVEDIADFAQQLFDEWKIGQKGNDNGLLVLLVQDTHQIRFHTGYGLEGILPDVVCKRIQTGFMVPEFKKGDFDSGVIKGIEQVKKILTDPAYAQELKADINENPLPDYPAFVIFLSIGAGSAILIAFFYNRKKFSDSKKPDDTLYPEMRLSRLAWITEFFIMPSIIVTLFGISGGDNPIGFCILSLYFYFLCTAIHRLWRMRNVINRFKASNDYYSIIAFIGKSTWYWFFIGLLFPFPLFIYFFYHLTRKKVYRNHPRNCSLCRAPMRKLNETEDDQFLTNAKRLEENLKSIDYDVWLCTSCQATEEWNFPAVYTEYKECPYCKTHAYYCASSRTLVSATYSSSGKGEQVHTCKFCSKSKKSTYTIAKLVQSSSGSGGSSYGGSSSSSGGGSWGGGSSGGGGATSSW